MVLITMNGLNPPPSASGFYILLLDSPALMLGSLVMDILGADRFQDRSNLFFLICVALQWGFVGLGVGVVGFKFGRLVSAAF
jgi:hypothetical protein